MFGGGELLMTV